MDGPFIMGATKDLFVRSYFSSTLEQMSLASSFRLPPHFVFLTVPDTS